MAALMHAAPVFPPFIRTISVFSSPNLFIDVLCFFDPAHTRRSGCIDSRWMVSSRNHIKK